MNKRCASCRMPFKEAEKIRVLIGGVMVHAACQDRYLIKMNIHLRNENRRLREALQRALAHVHE